MSGPIAYNHSLHSGTGQAMSNGNTLYENLVIGGGISGLGMAHLSVKQGMKTLLLERETRVGGCIRSHGFPDSGDFWVELGSHTCYNSYGNLLGMIVDLGLDAQLLHKAKVRFKVLDGERLASVFSRMHPLELALSLPRLFTEKKAGNSVADYYSRVLGNKNYRDLFSHAFNAVICQPADQVPADKLFRRKPRRKDMPRSFTLPDGLSSIPESIAGQTGLESRTGVSVQGIQRDADGFHIYCDDGGELNTRHLCVAVNPDQAAILLHDAFPELAGLLAGIRMVSIETLAVMVRRDELAIEPLAGIIAPNDDFYSAVSRDYLDHPDYRGFSFHFKPGRLDRDGKIERIRQVLDIQGGQIQAIAEHANRLPALRVGHDQRVRDMDRLLDGSGLALTGNYFLGVSIEDCLARSATEFTRLFTDVK